MNEHHYEAGAPNLDAQPSDELRAFANHARAQPIRTGRDLFPAKPKGYAKAAGLLAGYADNKATAMECRIRGDILGATNYEAYCEDIYKRLPAFARW